MNIEINQETCIHCKLCSRICPILIIDELEDGVQVNKTRISYCVKCGHCMAGCPSRSIQVEGFNYDEFGPMPKKLLDTEELNSFLRSRRSIRFYQDKPVPKEVIEQIIKVASCAPMGAPPTHVEVLVINDKELIQKKVIPLVIEGYEQLVKWSSSIISRFILKRQMGKDMFIALDSYLTPVVGQGVELYKQTGADCFLWNTPAIMLFHANRQTLCVQENCIIATVYARLAAESLGLGCCINGMAPPIFDRDKRLREMFSIPPENRVVSSFTFGYPKYKFARTTPWKFKSVKLVDGSS